MNELKLDRADSNRAGKPVLFVIMDGVGLYRGQSEGYDGNAFDQARTPNLDRLFREAVAFCELKAHGRAVGLPSDSDMGNSEVGHNAIGAGRVFEQGAKLVNSSIESGEIFRGEAWRELVGRLRATGGTLHFIGLLSDGNVHSHIDQLKALLRGAADEGIPRVRIHALADGRDVEPVTYHTYLADLEASLDQLRQSAGFDGAIASGGGRMKITMDRYNADWAMVERGWHTHVLGRGRCFLSATEAVDTLRAENPNVIDQDLPPFVIADENGRPVGPIEDGDAVVFFNYRGDRAIEISRAFCEDDFQEFDRIRRPDVYFAGMMEYDGDLHIPPTYLVEPPAIDRTISQYLVSNGVRQLAVAETQKFGHVTYFWNGNNSEKFDDRLEDWVEVPSVNQPFDTIPEMRAREVCDVVVDDLRSRNHDFVRVNFANGDMVGHTGSLDASIRAMEVVDECIGRLRDVISEVGGAMVVTADHGNLDMMYEVDRATGEVRRDDAGRPMVKTSHTLSPVPWALVGPAARDFQLNREVIAPELGNIAATLMVLLGFEPPRDYMPPLVVAAVR